MSEEKGSLLKWLGGILAAVITGVVVYYLTEGRPSIEVKEEQTPPVDKSGDSGSENTNNGHFSESRIDKGNLETYFIISELTITDGYNFSKNISFLAEARYKLSVTVFADFLDQQGVKFDTKIVDFSTKLPSSQNTTEGMLDKIEQLGGNWEQGERKRASLEIPSNVSKVNLYVTQNN